MKRAKNILMGIGIVLMFCGGACAESQSIKIPVIMAVAGIVLVCGSLLLGRRIEND